MVEWSIYQCGMDVNELEGMKGEIVGKNKLKVQMAVWGSFDLGSS